MGDGLIRPGHGKMLSSLRKVIARHRPRALCGCVESALQ